MRRRDVFKALGATSAVGVVSSPAIAQDKPKLRWRMPSSYPRPIDTLFLGAERFAQSVADLTEGNFQIQVFAPGDIVGAFQVADAVTNNTVEMGHTPPYYYVGKDPAFAFGASVPFGLNARQCNGWLHNGGGLELLNEFFAKHNIIGFPAGNSGVNMGGWLRKEVNTIADLQGLKFRIAGFGGNVAAKMGIVPQQIPAGEIYSALERGTIDGAEWVGPHDDEKIGFSRVAKYYYYPGWWEPAVTTMVMLNLDRWRELPPVYQKAVATAAADANQWVLGRYDTVNPAALKRLVETGVEFRPFSREIMQAAFDAAKGLYAELSQKNQEFKKLHDAYMSYRSDVYLWHQTAEYSYDSFMISQRSRR